MSVLSNSWLLGAIMVVTGFGIPVMAALNSGLGVRLGNPALAATILFAVALAVSATVALLQQKTLTAKIPEISPYFYMGGLFVASYVLAITWIAPRIGVGSAIFLVLFGQLVASGLVDHYGWFGAPRLSLTGTRCTGFVLMAIGLMLAQRPAMDA